MRGGKHCSPDGNIHYNLAGEYSPGCFYVMTKCYARIILIYNAIYQKVLKIIMDYAVVVAVVGSTFAILEDILMWLTPILRNVIFLWWFTTVWCCISYSRSAVPMSILAIFVSKFENWPIHHIGKGQGPWYICGHIQLTKTIIWCHIVRWPKLFYLERSRSQRRHIGFKRYGSISQTEPS